jgi:hypothetical protein
VAGHGVTKYNLARMPRFSKSERHRCRHRQAPIQGNRRRSLFGSRSLSNWKCSASAACPLGRARDYAEFPHVLDEYVGLYTVQATGKKMEEDAIETIVIERIV